MVGRICCHFIHHHLLLLLLLLLLTMNGALSLVVAVKGYARVLGFRGYPQPFFASHQRLRLLRAICLEEPFTISTPWASI